MSEKRTTVVHGRSALLKNMKRTFGTSQVAAQVGMRATSGVTSNATPRYYEKVDGEGKKRRVWPAPSKYVAESRDEATNIIIFRTQAKNGRNPAFTDSAEEAAIQKMWTESINKFMAGDTNALGRGALKIGEYIVAAIKRHVDEQRNARGKMRATTTDTTEQRKIVWGSDKILKASGQLMSALRWDYRLVKK